MTLASHGNAWACLMYHDTPPLEATDYFSVTGPSLERQLAQMRASTLHGQTLESILGSAENRSVVDKSVAITFDDGYLSNYEIALPLLAAQGATATIFVVTSWVGTKGYCGWSELRALQQAGWSIQSHTRSHPFLSQLSESEVRAELETSKQDLEQHLGTPVVTLSLPNGDYPRKPLDRLIQESGYQWVATSRWGANGLAQVAAREIRRYTVRHHTTAGQFAHIAGGRSTSLSPEGLRLSLLSVVRRTLGPKLYQSLRNATLSILE